MKDFLEYIEWLNHEIMKKNCDRNKEIVFNYTIRRIKNAKIIFEKCNEKDDFEILTEIFSKYVKKDIDLFANLILLEKIEYLESINNYDNIDIEQILKILRECYCYLSV
jgi:hypothetical protein